MHVITIQTLIPHYLWRVNRSVKCVLNLTSAKIIVSIGVNLTRCTIKLKSCSLTAISRLEYFEEADVFSSPLSTPEVEDDVVQTDEAEVLLDELASLFSESLLSSITLVSANWHHWKLTKQKARFWNNKTILLLYIDYFFFKFFFLTFYDKN